MSRAAQRPTRSRSDAEQYTAALVEKGILKPSDYPVAQLETGEGKEEPNKRLRFVVRVDHIEHAYHKEERPLFVQDYDQQQATDRKTFAALQTACKEAARGLHEADFKTKEWFTRMMPNYEARPTIVLAKKGEEYAKKNDAAARSRRRPSGKSKRESRRSTARSR
ncbi:hypothetical protein B0H13DRAFT_2066923 [Mycena leptocephala]|nr:hypothetical protein B0H13DRAFT_2066923 [Mycena leptocephala]